MYFFLILFIIDLFSEADCKGSNAPPLPQGGVCVQVFAHACVWMPKMRAILADLFCVDLYLFSQIQHKNVLILPDACGGFSKEGHQQQWDSQREEGANA